MDPSHRNPLKNFRSSSLIWGHAVEAMEHLGGLQRRNLTKCKKKYLTQATVPVDRPNQAKIVATYYNSVERP